MSSHPQSWLRAWALSKFADTDLCRAMTGIGSGTIKLADLDRDLIDILSKAQPSERAVDLFEETPQEIWLFSLAACFLLALIDGHFTDEESDLIEHILSNFIPDYRQFMNIKRVCKTIDELYMYTACSDQDNSSLVYVLISMTMKSDRVIQISELQFILMIGRMLDTEDMWRRFLAHTLKTVFLSNRGRSREQNAHRHKRHLNSLPKKPQKSAINLCVNL